MKKTNNFLVAVAAIILVIVISVFVGFEVLAAPSTETSAFVVVAASSKNQDQNSIIVNLYVTYAGPTVPIEAGGEEVIIEIIPGDSVIVVAQKMTAAVLGRATELGYTIAKGNIILPTYQKGQ